MKLSQLSEAEQRLFDNLVAQKLEAMTASHATEEGALTSDLSRRNIMASSYAITSFFALGNQFIVAVQQAKIDVLDEVLVSAQKAWTADLADALFPYIKNDASHRARLLRDQERRRWTRMGHPEWIPEKLPQHDAWLAGTLDKLKRELNIRVDRGLVRPRTPQATTVDSAIPTGNPRFRVALSFPGERREFVARVAEGLAGAIGKHRVLYDKYYEAEFARPNLDTHLQGLYHDHAELIVVFLCAEYEAKPWCGLEWRAIRDLIKRKEDSRVMFFRFDDADVSGLFGTDGYVPVGDHSPDDIANLILDRLAQSGGQNGFR